jgi:3,4-dihydroxy 2-butanone 4-phosphate synthase / GTP cyclohydrolase II
MAAVVDPIDAVTLQAEASLPTRYGTFNIAVFDVVGLDGSPGEVVALTHGALAGAQPPLVRLHSECLTGDVLGSLRCDCGEQLEAALALIAEAPLGVLLYLPQEGRGIGLANKIRAYKLQDLGLDTVDANLALGLPVDRRDYAAAAKILLNLGLNRIRLLTNNPLKSAALERHGIQIVERVPLTVPPNAVNRKYLRTKADRMGHFLAFAD